MKYTLLILFLLLNLSQAFLQSYSISGAVQSATENSTFPGATVVLAALADSTTVKGGVTALMVSLN